MRAKLTADQGICARSGDNTTCVISAGQTAARLHTALGLSADVGDVLPFALALQSKIFLFLPTVSGVLYLAGLLCFLLLKRDLKRPSSSGNAVKRRGRWKHWVLGLVYGSVAFALASAIGLAQAVAGLIAVTRISDSSSFPFEILAGIGLQVLQWLALAFLALFGIGTAIVCHDVTGSVAKSSKDGREKAVTTK